MPDPEDTRKPDDDAQSTKRSDGQGGDEPIPLKTALLLAAAGAAGGFGGAVYGVSVAMGGG